MLQLNITGILSAQPSPPPPPPPPHSYTYAQKNSEHLTKLDQLTPDLGGHEENRQTIG
jgi:hypothetical protein